MAKRLFDSKTEMLTKAGQKFDTAISGAVGPIVEAWYANGYSVRDMQSAIVSVIVSKLARLAIKRSIGIQAKEQDVS